MARSNADLLALKAELTNDPQSLGLTVLPADDETNSIKLNEVRVACQIKRRSVSTASVFGKIDPLEHQALSDQQARWLGTLIESGQLDPLLDTGSTTGIRQLFGAESNSRAAIESLFTESGNRIEQLYQAGTLEAGGEVTPSDVANARNAT